MEKDKELNLQPAVSSLTTEVLEVYMSDGLAALMTSHFVQVQTTNLVHSKTTAPSTESSCTLIH